MCQIFSIMLQIYRENKAIGLSKLCVRRNAITIMTYK